MGLPLNLVRGCGKRSLTALTACLSAQCAAQMGDQSIGLDSSGSTTAVTCDHWGCAGVLYPGYYAGVDWTSDKQNREQILGDNWWPPRLRGNIRIGKTSLAPWLLSRGLLYQAVVRRAVPSLWCFRACPTEAVLLMICAGSVGRIAVVTWCLSSTLYFGGF